jgi:hypothetical protein
MTRSVLMFTTAGQTCFTAITAGSVAGSLWPNPASASNKNRKQKINATRGMACGRMFSDRNRVKLLKIRFFTIRAAGEDFSIFGCPAPRLTLHFKT